MVSGQEREWLRKFYEGTFLVKGWKTQMQDLLEDFEGKDRALLDSRLSSLGEKIGREWAKDNAVRRIDTAKLKQWGAQLTQARKKGPERLSAEIDTIADVVDQLLT